MKNVSGKGHGNGLEIVAIVGVNEAPTGTFEFGHANEIAAVNREEDRGEWDKVNPFPSVAYLPPFTNYV